MVITLTNGKDEKDAWMLFFVTKKKKTNDVRQYNTFAFCLRCFGFSDFSEPDDIIYVVWTLEIIAENLNEWVI